MLKFIVYDDETRYINVIDKIIKETASNIKYDIVKISEYNEQFEKIINDDDEKIYILDIEIPDGLSGIEVARKIRKTDWDSVIIFITAHLEKVFSVVQAQIMILGLISKTNNFKTNLMGSIKTAIKKINENKVLTFTSSNITYRIYTDDIYYIVKDSVDRKCIIVNKYNSAIIFDNLNNIMKQLDDRFIYTSRSCIVNIEQINKVDWNSCIIYFPNGEKTDYLSRNKKKELRDKLEKLS